MRFRDERSVLAARRQEFENNFRREAAPLEKAHALRALFARGRRLAVFALENGARAFQLAFGGNAFDELGRDSLGFQVLADARRAELARQRARPLFREALFGELISCL